MSNAAGWLRELGLGEYADLFAENDIDLDVLSGLTEEHLKELGVSLGHRIKLREALSRHHSPQRSAEAGLDLTSTSRGNLFVERRQLTLMFIDLVGSTALSGRLDPEDMRELMLTYQNLVAGSIVRYEGYVAKYMGDGVLAYFGWPRAQGNDAERAVRAALAAIAAVEKMITPDGTALAARAGIATGLVVVGDLIGEGTAQEHAVIGETPNLAARLQSIALPSQVLIGPTTHELVGGIFEHEDLGQPELKGIAVSARVWRVIGERPAKRDLEVTAASLIGREEELGILRRAWQHSRQGRGQIVLINGEPGIGKSRLVQTLGSQLRAEGGIRITLRCSPYHENSALFPVIEHLRHVLAWRAEDTDETRLAKLERRLQGLRIAARDGVALFAALLSLPLPQEHYQPLNQTPQQRRQLTLDAIVSWLLEEAERQPILQVWEDIHWADPSTLELLGLMIEQCPTAPVLNIMTFRSEFAPPWPVRSRMIPLTLSPLDPAAVKALVNHQSGAKQLPHEVVEHIVSKTDGVPLYAEELTKAIMGSAFLHDAGGRYELVRALSHVSIPVTLQESLMAQLDREPRGRQVAQLGAVIGREFSFEMLNALGAVSAADLEQGLARLVEAKLIYQRGRPPRSHYVFKHALIRDAAYQSLLKRARRKVHQNIVDAVIQHFPDTADTQPEWVAYHCIEAASLDQALQFLKRAGQRASEHSSYAEARQHLSRCLELLDDLPHTLERARHELDVQMLLGSVLIHTSGEGAVERERVYVRARELCDQLDETQKLLTVLLTLRRYYVVHGDSPKAGHMGEELLERARATEDKVLYISACNSLGIDMFYVGNFTKAHALFEDGAARYISAKQLTTSLEHGVDVGLHCVNWLSWTLWMLGSPDAALRRSEEALTIAEKHPHPYSRCTALHWSAVLHQFLQNPNQVEKHALALNALSTEHNVAQWLASSKILHGWSIAMNEERDRGLELLKEGFDAWCAIGIETAQPYWLALFAEVYKKYGLTDQGLAALKQARTQTESTGEVWWDAELHRLTGELLVQRNHSTDLETAHTHFEHAGRIAGEQKARALKRRISASMDAI